MKIQSCLACIWIACCGSNLYADNATRITAMINHSAAVPVDNEFNNSRKGFIANTALPDTHILNMDNFAFESGIRPNEVNPSLWQQARLNHIQGLFKVTDSVYQIRGYDISNMSIVEGRDGIIIIDTLTSAEAAKSALELYYNHRPFKPVVAVIYTHSHADHFGGVKGVISLADVLSHKVQVIAPQGLMQHSISENVYAGNAMSRRGNYMYGINLIPGKNGFVDEGLGKAFALGGSITLIPPTLEITTTGTKLTLAGVDFIFELTPDTEAPAEMNIYLPQLHALDMAENSSKTLHNFYTLRGAQVRDSKAWATYLDEAIKKYAADAQVMFTQHTWPTWGSKQIITQLENQRDEILYIHDQTLRLANMGYTPNAIAESIQMPKELYQYGYERGYYGTVKHNVKAVYQKYLGCYDSNPVNLDPLPEVAAAKKYVEYMGGSNAIIRRAKKDYASGNYRWVANVMNYITFAEPNNTTARNLEARALEQLGYQSEAATWRNEYLSAADELRHGVKKANGATTLTADIAAAMTVPEFFDNLAIHLNPQKVNGITVVTNWKFPDIKQEYTTVLHNSVLRYQVGLAKTPDFSITINKTTLTSILTGKIALKALEHNSGFVGDRVKFTHMSSYFDKFNSVFTIIEP